MPSFTAATGIPANSFFLFLLGISFSARGTVVGQSGERHWGVRGIRTKQMKRRRENQKDV